MKKLVLAVFALMFTISCAADLVVSSGAVAEGKKQEAEQAAEQKQQILDQLEEQRKQQEERKKQLEEI